MESELSKEPSMVKQIQFVGVTRRIKLLGYGIMFGVTVIYMAGLIVEGNVNIDLAILNLASLIFCPVVCIISILVKKILLRTVTAENFQAKYFTAHIAAFALCDGGGLFCIATNLFVNENQIYASFGLVVALIFIWLNFPKQEDFDTLQLGRHVF